MISLPPPFEVLRKVQIAVLVLFSKSTKLLVMSLKNSIKISKLSKTGAHLMMVNPT